MRRVGDPDTLIGAMNHSRSLIISAIVIGSVAPSASGVKRPAAGLVDIGSHKLDVLQAGSGTPAIVFEAGLGNELDAWQHVWPSVARFSSIVVYSRAGLGRSPRGPMPHTVGGAADDLHALVTTLGVKPPIVLVGASYGGLIVRVYASRFPSDVGGVVLVEGVHEQQVRRYGELDPTYPDAFRTSMEAQLETASPGEADEIRETMRVQAAGAVDGLKPLPDVPIAVLTSMRADPNAAYVNGTPRGHQAWRAMHEEWFLGATDAMHIETPRSGHHLQDDEPQLVVDAIRFVRDRVARRPPA
jgi:pimeloyl-ACP methyl ester carboxylesterase